MRIITFLISLLIATFLSACGGGGGSPGLPSIVKTPITTTAPAKLVLAVGGSQGFNVIGGAFPMKAIASSNTQVATAVLDGSNFWIGGSSSGTADIVITDALGQLVTIAVTVENLSKFYTTAPASLVMSPSSSTREFTIFGGQPPYRVVSDNPLVAATTGSSGSVFRVTPFKTGSANITVQDSATPTVSSAIIAVTVKSPVILTVSPTDVSSFIGMPVTVHVTGGTPPYRVGGLIPAAVSFSFVEGLTDPTTFVVTPLLVSSGLELKLSFIDSQNETVTMKLTGIDGQPKIRMAPASLTVSEVDSQNIELTLFGYFGDVTAYSDNPKLLTATVDATDKSKITLKTGSQGNRCVLSETKVTITAIDANRSLAQTVVTIANNGNATVSVADPADPTKVITTTTPCPP